MTTHDDPPNASLVRTRADLESWIDRIAIDRHGQRVGVIVDAYANDISGAPEWLAVVTGLFGSRLSFVPLSGAVEVDGHVRVPFERQFIKDSPNVEADGRLDGEEETRLYRYYGLPVPPVIDVDRVDIDEAVDTRDAGYLVEEDH